MNTIVPPMATISSRSSDRSCSTSTRSTMTCVKTGSTICRTLTTTASASALTMEARCGRTIGQSQARLRAARGRLLERGGVVEERRVARPPPLELFTRNATESDRRIGDECVASGRRDTARASGRHPSGRWRAAACDRGCAGTPSPNARRVRAPRPRCTTIAGSCRRGPC